MKLALTCPTCGYRHAIPESFVGKKVVCPRCHERFPVPAPPGHVAAADQAEEELAQAVVSCPACDYAHAIPETYRGRTLVCPQCRTAFRVRGVLESTRGAAGLEMPAATAWPLVLGLGVALAAMGLATSVAVSAAGVVLFLIGLFRWIGELLPGRGHAFEKLLDADRRPRAIAARPGTVDELRPGMAGFRFRLPERVHPIRAGFWGGVVGGLVMPVPALIYGVLSGHGIWYPINLLAGMVLPSIDPMTIPELEQFSASALAAGIAIHVVLSIGIGLMYGVLLPTLPPVPGGPLLWGGLLMPLFWTAASYGLMGVANPILQRHVDWHWFVLSQFVFGLAASLVILFTEKVAVPPAGSGARGAASS